jgi:hypothetical protein
MKKIKISKLFVTTALSMLIFNSCSKEEVCTPNKNLNGEYYCDSCGDNSPYNSTSNRIGAQCNNGERVSSTGSGTCSGKGGVYKWICK